MTDQKCKGVCNALNIIVVRAQVKILFNSKEFNNNPSNVIDHYVYQSHSSRLKFLSLCSKTHLKKLKLKERAQSTPVFFGGIYIVGQYFPAVKKRLMPALDSFKKVHVRL